jgi:FkbM family methyltransferase
MSRVNRLLGVARSVAIYHGIPYRQRRLRRFYTAFVSSGDLVFDIGAHAGNRTRALAALGCRVVAVEPQPDFARLLRALFAGSRQVTVVEAAVATRAGRSALSISERTPTVTTVDEGWRDARAREPDFRRVRWNDRVDVETTTLDALIERFAVPAFVKIDVEGGEPAVLGGLNHAVGSLSFEYLPRALDYARRCTERLSALGPYLFNWSAGESSRLAEDRWMSAAELMAALATPAAQRRPGDVYARLVPRTPRPAAANAGGPAFLQLDVAL